MILPPGNDDQSGFMASVPSGGFNFNWRPFREMVHVLLVFRVAKISYDH
jgi:hypothetical protein